MASIPQPIVEPTRAEILQRLAATHRALAATMEAQAAALDALAESPEPTSDDDMLTTTEAAALLRRSPAHVRTQCKSGAIKAMADGRGWRIRRSELARYERRRTR